MVEHVAAEDAQVDSFTICKSRKVALHFRRAAVSPRQMQRGLHLDIWFYSSNSCHRFSGGCWRRRASKFA
jgi:hypothetical protein